MKIQSFVRCGCVLLGVMSYAACSDSATSPTAAIQPSSSPSFAAGITYPAPPTCHTDIRSIEWRRGVFAFYEFASEYRGRRLVGPPPPSVPRGSYLYERIYVYHVQNMIYPWGLVPAGRAEKVCGSIIARA